MPNRSWTCPRRSILRRTGLAEPESSRLVFEDVELDEDAHEVRRGEAIVDLTATEYRLLRYLMLNPRRVLTRAQLLDHVWGGSVYVEERTVDVHIRRLRKTLEPFNAENMVQTVRGAGYRFSTAT